MTKLSIFVDESGDFGNYQPHSPYYIVTMVFHDQAVDLSQMIQKLDRALCTLGYGSQAIHTGPLIRREVPYQYFTPNERRAIFTKLYYFMLNCNIQYQTFVSLKKECHDTLNLERRMWSNISYFISEHLSYFQQFEKVILYYDNGQHELSRILNSTLTTHLPQCDIRRVQPSDYRLFQVADMLCTLELLHLKIQHNNLSKSEQQIFHTKHDLKKDFLKQIQKKKLV